MPSPILAATLQAAALSTASNLCAQFLEAYQNKHAFTLDMQQLARFLALTFMTTPPNYMWQQFLERTFPAHPSRLPRKDHVELKSLEEAAVAPAQPGAGSGAGDAVGGLDRSPRLNLRNTLTKWFVDCIVVGAIANTVAFLVIMGVLKGQPGAQIWRNVETETIPIILAGYKMWPIASIISFSFIPVHRRVVFLSFVGLLWGIYMSLVAARV
ncbi:peroxisomal protein [Hirsutella rhossiliensis]|uniref:Mpv17 / PMP22 family domain-containing protein n=1 Tax=Hirsutella rhossiliensis TaxID=111463 RepID=A0A9P8MW43_9HYPO|nr:mpv17 / PMP22 family domain-containing protein [Hirsutella rhossiliensis]KAH0960252.1 mpv17 / PMP22 family domain-containing protein [Hirsutella rhossiliensis]